MFAKFQSAVRNAYLDLKNNGELDFDRAWPSPGELKSWSMSCYLRGLSKEDETVFIRFFNRERSTKELIVLIEQFDLDKLRPLRNFISGDTQKRPDENIVKLLAVLINFNPRPYRAIDWDEQVHSVGSKKEVKNHLETAFMPPGFLVDDLDGHNIEKKILLEKKLDEELQEGKSEKKNELITQTSKKKKSNHKTIIYALAGLTIIFLCSVIYYNMDTADCMCWNGEQYVEIDCQDSTQSYQIVGLNKNKLMHFRKITRQDTLNLEDVGKVWYSKIDKRIEFFTYPGHHPVHHEKSLKAATKHIIENYAGVNVKSE